MTTNYLIVYRPRSITGDTAYDFSIRKDAMYHIKALDAQTVWVYDKDGWWVSFADRDSSGNPYKPKMLPDGEPRSYYKKIYDNFVHIQENGLWPSK